MDDPNSWDLRCLSQTLSLLMTTVPFTVLNCWKTWADLFNGRRILVQHQILQRFITASNKSSEKMGVHVAKTHMKPIEWGYSIRRLWFSGVITKCLTSLTYNGRQKAHRCKTGLRTHGDSIQANPWNLSASLDVLIAVFRHKRKRGIEKTLEHTLWYLIRNWKLPYQSGFTDEPAPTVLRQKELRIRIARCREDIACAVTFREPAGPWRYRAIS